MKRLVLVGCVAGSLLLGLRHAVWAQGPVLRRGVEAVLEAVGKKGARELAAFGGETAVRQVLEQAEREGGEALLKKVVQYGEKYGVAALAGMKRSPKLWVRSLDELPEEVARKALQAVKRDPDLMSRLVTDYGTDALRLAAQHPGVGEQIIKTLGREGLEVAQGAATASAIKLSRLAAPIAQLPPGPKAQLLAALKQAPGKLIDFLEQHPKVLLTGAGVASFLAAKDQILGGYQMVTDQNGNVRPLENPGLLARLWQTTAATFHAPLSALIGIAALILLAWGGIKIWGAFRVERAQVRAQEAKSAQASARQKEEEPR